MGENINNDEDQLVRKSLSRDERKYISSKHKQQTQSTTTTSI
jgi:hypothetical protein